MTDPSEDPNADSQYHLGVSPDEVAETALMPGDPERIDTIIAEWDTGEIVAKHREYRTATGTVEDVPISATSTGIGSPSAGIAVEELARCGVETFIRVGSCGSLRRDVPVGDLVITSGAIRGEGTSDEYIREDYPAAADDRVIAALVGAAEELGYDYHVGTTYSTDSFYAGQARPGFDGYEAPGSDGLLSELRGANVTNIEMEASAILTLASLFGLRAGAVCTVYANRETGEFEAVDDTRAAAVASRAAVLLAGMDQAVAKSGAARWHPGLTPQKPNG